MLLPSKILTAGESMRNFRSDLIKIFTSGGFYAAVLFMLLLLFSSNVYTDNFTNNRYNVIGALAEIDVSKMFQERELCDKSIMENVFSNWSIAFLPIISSFCFVPTICAEREAGAVRYGIFRSSRLKFSVSRYFSGVLCGGLAVALGYALFCGFVYLNFPALEDYEAVYGGDGGFSFSLTLLGLFMTSAFWSMPAMVLTSFMRNKYLIMCIPLFIKYGISQFVLEESHKAIRDIENINVGLLNFLSIISPDAMIYIGRSPDYIWILVNFGAFSAAFFAIYIIAEGKRGDCGA